MLLASEGPTQIAVGCIVCAVYTVYFLWSQPLGLMLDHIMELITSIQLLLTLIMGLYLKAMDGQEKIAGTAEERISEGVLIAIFGLVGVLGAVMVVLVTQKKRLRHIPSLAWMFKDLERRDSGSRNARKVKGQRHGSDDNDDDDDDDNDDNDVDQDDDDHEENQDNKDGEGSDGDRTRWHADRPVTPTPSH